MTHKSNPRNETLHDGEWGDLTKAVFGITDRKKAKADLDELHGRLGICCETCAEFDADKCECNRFNFVLPLTVPAIPH